MRKNALLSGCVLLGLAASPAAAQQTETAETAASLETLVVTATRAPRPISAIPGSVTVVDRATIEEQLRLSGDPADALAKLIPGYSASNQTISGSAETFRGRSVLILVDGVPRNTPLRDVSRIASLIDLNDIERIEVVNGASSLHGSGSTGGTINFITRSASPGAPRITVNTALRAFTGDLSDSLAPELSLSATGTAEAFDYAATVTGRRSGRTYDGNGNELPSDPFIGQGGADRLREGNANLRLGRTVGPRRFELGGEWTYLTQSPDWLSDYSRTPVQPDRDSPYPGKSIREDSRYLTGRFTDSSFSLGDLQIQGFYNDINKRFGYAGLSVANPFVYYSGNPLDPISANGQTELQSERAGLSTTIDTSLDTLYQGLTLTWGGDYAYDRTRQRFLDGVDAISPMQQHNYAAFGQIEAPVGESFLLRGGLRHERFHLKVDDFTRPAYVALLGGSLYPVPAVNVIGGNFSYAETTYNIGAVAFLNDQIELFGGFSQGFELPDVGSFTRRAGLGATGTIDYSDIGPKAQIVNSYELGLRGNWRQFRGTITGFVSTSKHGVNFDSASNTIEQQKERIHGLEFTGEVDLSSTLTLGTLLAYREGKRDTDGDGSLDAYLPNNRIATPFRAVGYATYQLDLGLAEKLRLRGELEYFSSRDRDDGTTRQRIDDAATVNLLGSYPLYGGEFGFGLRNLFDVNYENPTATATRNIPVSGFGRVMTVSYRKTF